MALSWVSTDLRTGVVLADLPDLGVDRVSAVLGTYTTALASLPYATAPEGWLRATLHGGSCMVLLDDSVSGYPVPVWGGYVTVRKRGSGDTMPLSLATLEAALDRFYIREDVTYTGVGQNAIVADLIDRFVTTLPIRVEYTGAGTLRDREYLDAGDRSILSALTELAGLEGGIEWTIGWEWQHDPERITPVLFVGERIGSSPGEGFGPAATFEMPGAVTEVELTEDYSAGKGATDVMAVSTASANVRPQSPHQVADDVQRPTFEHRFTPSTDITDVATLTLHAAQALAGMRNGARALSLSAVVSAAPRLGVEWSIGDDVGYRIGGVIDDPTIVRDPADFVPDDYSPDFDISDGVRRANLDGKPSVPAFPEGLAGVARAIGWELTLTGVQTVTPILVLADEGA